MKKRKEFIRRIPKELQEHFKIQRFKISLIKCDSKKEFERIKRLLHVVCDEIFEEFEDYTTSKAQKYLKVVASKQILKFKNIDYEEITKASKEDINKKTIVDIIEDEIEKRKVEFENKQKDREKVGIDTSIKNDTTLRAYKNIKSHLIGFGEILDKDYKNLTNSDFEGLRECLLKKKVSDSSVRTYYKHLRAIFNKLVKTNDIQFNPIIIPKASSTRENKIFSFPELELIRGNLEDERLLIFDVLLYSGMRFEELSSIKKKDIRNDCFYFFDAKGGFRKIVPIHRNILNDIKNILNDIKDDDYLFENDRQGVRRVSNIRTPLNKLFKKLGIDKTLHKTRANFISYLNYFGEEFNHKDITSLTHSLSGIDDKIYSVGRNREILRKIVNSIELDRFKELDELR